MAGLADLFASALARVAPPGRQTMFEHLKGLEQGMQPAQALPPSPPTSQVPAELLDLLPSMGGQVNPRTNQLPEPTPVRPRPPPLPPFSMERIGPPRRRGQAI